MSVAIIDEVQDKTIFEIKKFQNGDGQEVQMLCPVNSTDTLPKFVGTGYVMVEFSDPNTGARRQRPHPLTFIIPNALTIESAFDQFESAMEEHVKKVEQEYKKSMNTPKLYIPNSEESALVR